MKYIFFLINENTIIDKATEASTNTPVAIKRYKQEKSKEGFPLSALREFCSMISLKHENIVDIKEIVSDSNNKFYFFFFLNILFTQYYVFLVTF